MVRLMLADRAGWLRETGPAYQIDNCPGCGGVRRVSDTPHVPASDEVAWLRAQVAELEDLTAQLREAAAARDELAAAQLAARDAQIAALAALVEELRRRLDKDSSSHPTAVIGQPVYEKPRDRCARQVRTQAGQAARRAILERCGSHPIPGRRCCAGPTAAAAGARPTASRCWARCRTAGVRGVPPPPPVVTEYQVGAKCCPACGEIRSGWHRPG